MRGEGGTSRLNGWLSELRRAIVWHRRLLAAALAACAVGAGLTVLAPDPPPSIPVLAAARNLTAGAVLSPDDVTVVTLPPDAVPDGAVRPNASLLDRVLAGPVRRGEPLTDVRFIGSPLIASLADGLVAAPVRIADAGAAALLRPGDVVDIIATGQPEDFAQAASTRIVASGIRVISIPAAESGDVFAPAGFDGGALVVLATTPGTARDLAGAAVTGQLSVIVRPD